MDFIGRTSLLILPMLISAIPVYSGEHSQKLPLQRDNLNSIATVTQIGEEQRARIQQRNIIGGVLTGTILQNGIGNDARLSLEGGNLSGTIIQDGNDNRASLKICGQENNGAIEQYGDNNAARLRIDGYGKDVSLIQEGNGQNFRGPIKVGGDTPPGPITIRQY